MAVPVAAQNAGEVSPAAGAGTSHVRIENKMVAPMATQKVVQSILGDGEHWAASPIMLARFGEPCGHSEGSKDIPNSGNCWGAPLRD